MAKANPFAKFEKSGKDKDTKAVLKKYGPEGSKKEESFDRKQMASKAKKGK
jgi:hypothetical protein